MILLELVELVAASHKPSVAPGDGVIVSCACRLWTAADMERLVERLEKAVERLENVCQGPGMCGDASAKGEAQGSSQGTAELAQGRVPALEEPGWRGLPCGDKNSVAAALPEPWAQPPAGGRCSPGLWQPVGCSW